MNILFLQPLVAHYRVPFFRKIHEEYNIDILVGRKDDTFEIYEDSFITKVKGLFVLGSEYFFILKHVFKKKPQVIITYGEVKQISNIILLILKPFFKYKLVFWSHGFKHKSMSIIDKIRLFQMTLADAVFFYTQACELDAAQRFSLDKTYCLNNTIQFQNVNLREIFKNKSKLKEIYKIKTRINGLFISRFTKAKKPELLLELMIRINKLNKNIGFIIVGEGDYKPDFSNYDFIYDFGRVYDESKKKELFSMADFSFMPRWIGLSIVEGFSYGLPMFTLSDKIRGINHSVEFYYLKNNFNGFIAHTEVQLVDTISTISKARLQEMGKNAYNYVNKNLKMDNMVENFCSAIEELKRDT